MALNYSLVRTVEPSAFVSLDQAKSHLRVDHNQDDQQIAELVKAAIEKAEEYTNRSFAQQSWRTGYNFWQAIFEMPRAPLVSVESINYIDTDGQWQVVPDTVYRVLTDPFPGLVVLAENQSWPDKQDALQTITIEYTSGNQVEARATQAVLLTIGNWYENRESVITGTISVELPDNAKFLLNQLKVGLYP